MTLLRSLVARFRDALGHLFFNEETRVARFTVVAEFAGGFSVPHSGGISDRHFQAINAPGVVPQSLPVIFMAGIETTSSEWSAPAPSTLHPLLQGQRRSTHSAAAVV